MNTLRRADAWFFEPAPAERLATLRLLCGAFAAVYLVVRLPVFLELADNEAWRFEPVGIVSWLSDPLPRALYLGLLAAALLLAVAFTAGAWFRVTGPAFALVLLVLTTYRSSWGQLLHFENLMTLQVLVVGFSRAADTLSVDARHGPSAATPPADGDARAPAYGWPVRLLAVVTVLTYVLAGVAKLRIGGLEWMLGDTLRNHIAYAATRLDLLGGTPSPLAGWLVGQDWLFPPMAVATVAIELAAPVALLGGRARTAWVVAAWLMHASIAALMLIVFPSPLFLVGFAPFFDLERVPQAVRRWRARARPSGRLAQ